jgi:hypothetical protein
VNRYAIPISGQILFNNVCYINTGTYENPNSANPNSLGLVLKYAFENKNNTNLTELLNAKINSATLLSWKKSLEAGMYNYDFTNFGQKTVANYKKAINAVMNALNKR